jgi:hypothetical protein
LIAELENIQEYKDEKLLDELIQLVEESSDKRQVGSGRSLTNPFAK